MFKILHCAILCTARVMTTHLYILTLSHRRTEPDSYQLILKTSPASNCIFISFKDDISRAYVCEFPNKLETDKRGQVVLTIFKAIHILCFHMVQNLHSACKKCKPSACKMQASACKIQACLVFREKKYRARCGR